MIEYKADVEIASRIIINNSCRYASFDTHADYLTKTDIELIRGDVDYHAQLLAKKHLSDVNDVRNDTWEAVKQTLALMIGDTNVI